jgi:uncharacterized protein (DUF488 family)
LYPDAYRTWLNAQRRPSDLIQSTIGYEAATLHGLIAKLQAAGVKVVVDVRAVAASVIASERPAALLCFEACAPGCRRRIVADMISTATGCEVRDL